MTTTPRPSDDNSLSQRHAAAPPPPSLVLMTTFNIQDYSSSPLPPPLSLSLSLTFPFSLQRSLLFPRVWLRSAGNSNLCQPWVSPRKPKIPKLTWEINKLVVFILHNVYPSNLMLDKIMNRTMTSKNITESRPSYTSFTVIAPGVLFA